MQFREYWLILSKRWWLVVLVAAVASVASYGYSHFQTRVYRSEVQLTVAPSSLDYGLTLVIDNLLTQYQQELSTRQLAGQVDDALQLDLPVDKLLSKVRVSAVSNGYLLDIQVDDTDPNRAQQIALVWANKFIEQHQAEMAPLTPQTRIEIKLLDKPLVGQLVFPKTKQYVVAAGLLGLVAGGVLAFLLEYIDDTVKSGEEVERLTGLPLVGSIPIAPEVTVPAPNGKATASVVGGRH